MLAHFPLWGKGQQCYQMFKGVPDFQNVLKTFLGPQEMRRIYCVLQKGKHINKDR